MTNSSSHDSDADGVEVNERLGRFDWSVTPLGPPDQWPASLRVAVGQVLATRIEVAGHAGQDRPLAALPFAAPLREENGVAVGITAVASAVTEQVETREKTGDSEQRYVNLLLQVPFAVVIYRGAQLRVELASAAALEVFGKSWEEIAHQPIASMFPAMGLPQWYAIHEQVFATGQSIRTTERELTFQRNGQPYTGWFNSIYEPLLDADGVIDGVIAIGHDVSEQVLARRKIEESEQQKIGILNSLNAHIAVLDNSGEIIMVNEAWNIFALANGDTALRETGIGKNYLAVLEKAKGENAEEAPMVSAGIQAVFEEDLPIYSLEYPCHSPTQQRWFMLQVSPLTYAGGGVVIAHTDISARRLSEVALRESEHLLRALSESLEQKVQERTAELTEVNEAFEHAEAISLMGNYKWNLERNTIIWSKNMYAIYGVTPAIFTPTLENIMAFTHPEDVEKVTANTHQAFEMQISLPIGYRIIAADDVVKHVYGSGNIIVNEAGHKIMVGTLQDVTADVEKEQQLLQANEQLQQKNQEVALSKYNRHFLTDFSERFASYKVSTEFFNTVVQYIADLTHLDYVLVGRLEESGPDEFSIHTIAITAFGQLADNIVYPLPHGPCEQVVLGNLYAYPETCRIMFPKNQTLVQFNVEGYIGYPLYDVTGKAKGLIAVMHEQKIEDVETVSSILKIVAKRTEMELQRVQHEQQLQQSNQLLATQNAELEKSNLDLEQFAHIASHDLQEPLRKIQTFTGLLRRRNDDPAELAKYTQKIEESAFRMSQLIESVLNYSRVSQGQDLSEKTDLNDIIAHIRTDFELVIQEKNVVVESSVLPTIPGVPLQLSQLFSNLFSNALKFSTGHPHIRISAQALPAQETERHPRLDPAREYVCILFEDNGIGFSQEYAERIFDIFQRLHNKQTYAGTGIGLALCKKIVENHGGIISARGVLGKGARFDIYLPK